MDIKRIFEKHGREVTLVTPEDFEQPPFRAFLQPLRYKNKMYLEGIPTDLGYNPQDYSLYIGPADRDLTLLPEEYRVRIGGTDYKISKTEKVYSGATPVYIWAVLRPLTYDDQIL
ncbi:MAG: hypothetical protein GX851_08315 [Clostridiales bacterium]|nr:hypothetical protein [Clostridiales bacterium]